MGNRAPMTQAEGEPALGLPHMDPSRGWVELAAMGCFPRQDPRDEADLAERIKDSRVIWTIKILRKFCRK
jgi:hypothetical protein